MADKKDLKDLEDSTKDLTRLFQTQTKSVQELYNLFKGLSDGPVSVFSRKVELAGENFENIVQLNRDLKKDLIDVAQKEGEIQKLMLGGLSAKVAELTYAKKIAIANAEGLGMSEEQLKTFTEQYDQAIKNQTKLDEINKTKEEDRKISDKILEIDKDRQEILEKINTNVKLFKAVITDSRAAAAVFTSQLIKGYDTVKDLFSEVRKEGFTVLQSFRETGTAIGDAFSFSGVSAKQSLDIMKGMREEMGSIEEVTKAARIEAGSLALTYGIGAEEAGKLTAQFAMMPEATMETANDTLEFAGNLAKAAGVAPGAVMRDIAKNSEEVARFSKDGGKNIGVAAVAAKKLGMEFGSLTKMADQLLDFESSINKQMEASVLLGKEINLDKAREMALNGDLAGMTQEILANVGGEAEYNKMNVLQRKALADSMGVSVSELNKMVKNQDALNDLTQEQQEALASGELTMDEILANSGGFVAKLKEGGMTIFSMVGAFGEFSEGFKAAKDAASGLFSIVNQGLAKMMGLGKGAGGTKDIIAEVPDKAQKLQQEAPAMDEKKGQGTGGFMKGLAEGLKSFASGKVLVGAVIFAASAVLLGGALAGVALAYQSLGGDPMTLIGLGAALVGFGISMSIIGKFQGQIMQGALAMLVLGAALIPAAFAFSLLAGVDVSSIIAFSVALPLLALAAAGLGFLLIPIAMGALALAALGGGMIAVGAGLMVMQAGAGGLVVFQMLMMTMAEMGAAAAVGLALTSVGLVAFGASALLALPGMFLMSFALMMLTPSLLLLNKIGESNSLGSISESLVAISSAREGLGAVGMSIMMIAGGLGLMAIAGIGALPAIGALIALAAVAPALTALSNSLGGMFGGGGERGKEDKMDVLIAKIDQLITVASQGGTVNMDGKKVGDVIRLGLNSSGIR